MAKFCIECERLGKVTPVFSKGYCRNHQYKKENYDSRSIMQKAVAKQEKKIHKGTFDVGVLNSEIIPVTTTPESFNGEQINRAIMDEVGTWTAPKDNIGMDAFWKYAEGVIIKGGSKCWECGDIISRSDYRNSTGHIFPKSLFPSVADNIYNFVVVGNRCGCHHKTHTLSTFSQMSIFPTVVNRYLKFGHLITENHKYLDLFLEYANQII